MTEKFEDLIKKTKDHIEILNYAEFKDFILGLTLNGAERSDEDFSPFYAAVSKTALEVQNNPKDPVTHFAAYKNAERGVVLVIFKIKFYEKNGKGCMQIVPSFVEKPSSFRCPRKVLDLITDKQAAYYKSQVDIKYPVEEEQRLRAENLKELLQNKPTVKLTQEDTAVL